MENSNKKAIKYILKTTNGYKLRLFLYFALEIFHSSITPMFILPIILALIANTYQSKTLNVSNAMGFAFLYSFFFSLSGLIRFLFVEKLRYNSIIKMENNLRKNLFDSMLNHSINYFNSTFSGILASKINNISHNLGNIFESATTILSTVIVLIISSFIYVKINLYLGIFFVVWACFFVFFQAIFSKKIKNSVKKSIDEHNKVGGLITDAFVNISNIKSFAGERKELKNVRKQSISAMTEQSFVLWNMTYELIFLFFMITGVVFVTIAYSFYLTFNNKMAIGTFLFISQNIALLKGVIYRVHDSCLDFMIQWTEMRDGLDTILQKTEIENKNNAKILQIDKAKISLKNINFSYDSTKLNKHL